MQPWPIAFTHVQTEAVNQPIRLAIQKVSIVDQPSSAQPGTRVAGEGLCVATGDGVIRIERLQPAGKREMVAEDFLRGHSLPPGTIFT